jgi:hypothetical protein
MLNSSRLRKSATLSYSFLDKFKNGFSFQLSIYLPTRAFLFLSQRTQYLYLTIRKKHAKVSKKND